MFSSSFKKVARTYAAKKTVFSPTENLHDMARSQVALGELPKFKPGERALKHGFQANGERLTAGGKVECCQEPECQACLIPDKCWIKILIVTVILVAIILYLAIKCFGGGGGGDEEEDEGEEESEEESEEEGEEEEAAESEEAEEESGEEGDQEDEEQVEENGDTEEDQISDEDGEDN